MRLLSNLIAIASLFAGLANAQDATVEARIRPILQERLEAEKTVGIAVGFINDRVMTVVALGETAAENGRAVDGDTIFELGSITKAYTGTLLADMANRGELKFDENLRALLAHQKTPERNGKFISLQMLAQHTSGLPRLPENFAPKDSRDPYADYSEKMMFDFLKNYKLTRDPGEKSEYSNYGSGLLGQLLGARVKKPYEDLLRERFFAPLKMDATYVRLPAELKPRFTNGHDELLRTTMHWDMSVFSAAGALRSSVNDQLKWLDACLGNGPPRIVEAIQAATVPRVPAGVPSVEVALGWHVTKANGGEIIWHNGGTGGFRTFLGYVPSRKIGVVVLSNATNGVDDIGMHLLDMSLPLTQQTVVKIPQKTLESFVGEYPLAPGFVITVALEGKHLIGQATGQPKFAMRATSPTTFAVAEVDAEVSFANVDGVTELTLKQSGQTLRGKRKGAANAVIPAAPPEEVRKAVEVDPKTLQRYEGVFELDPAFSITITRDGKQLFAQATGQEKFEILAESETKFFYTVTNAQITFQKVEGDKAYELILHQRGQSHTGRRRKD